MKEHVRVVDFNSPQTNAVRGFRHNRIKTSRYTVLTFVPLNLFEQFTRIANVYFLMIAILQQIPGVSPLGNGTTALTLAVVMGFTAVKEGVEDWHRHKNDDDVNNRKAIVARGGLEYEVAWRELVVGDVVRCTDKEFFPADLLLLASSGPQGMCYIETSNLDGETNLKIRQALPATQEVYGELSHLRGALRCDPPNAAMYSFAGELALSGVATDAGVLRAGPKQILLRESQLRNTRWVYGLVVYTGQDTKIMKSSNKVRSKKSNVERITNSLIVLVFFFELVLCAICAVGNGVWLGREKNAATYLALEGEEPASAAALSFLTFLILFSNLIPISLYVSMETVKFGQSKLIDADLAMYYPDKDIACISRTSSLNEELGQVEYIFSDKTGTLTRNLMEFKKMTVAGVAYGEATGALPLPTVAPPRLSPAECAMLGPTTTADVASTPFAAGAAAPHFCFVDEDRRLGRAMMSDDAGPHLNEFFTLLAVCHTVIPEPDQDSDEPGALVYQAASPDEGALVNAAAAFGWRFHTRTPSSISIDVYGDGHTHEYEILHVNAFNSTRKRMSVVVRTPPADGSRLMVYCKGADTMLYELLDRNSPLNAATADVTLRHLDAYAKEGLRTLVCGARALGEDEYADWQARVDAACDLEDGRKAALAKLAAEIETDLVLLGATAIEDRLQDAVPDTIADLRAAGIKIWVLTGDKQETAIMIGKSCKLLDPAMRILIPNQSADDEASLATTGPALRAELAATLDSYIATMAEEERAGTGTEFACVVDGATLELLLGRPDASAGEIDAVTAELTAKLLTVSTACKSVIGCRVSPAQKAQVVKFVQDALHPVTLSIGDGANDVDMIKEAHIGVGINGEEGGQAALSADYAIGQFKYLKPLLLVHGHWCYHRIAKLIFYSFYKNIALALVPFWFVFANGYSGQTFVEKWTFSLYNVIYTALPILMVGLYDQCITRPRLEELPQLYRSGPANRFFNIKSFAGWLLSALYHSLVFYYMGEAVAGEGAAWSSGQTAGLYFNGLIIMSCIVITVTLKLMLETNTFNVLTWAALLLNGGGYFVFIVMYSFFGPAFPDAWDMYFVGPMMLASPRFWLAALLIPVVALAPDVAYKFARRQWWPEPYVIVQERSRTATDASAPLLEDAPLLGYSSTPHIPVTGQWVADRANVAHTSSFAYDNAPEEHVDLIMDRTRPLSRPSQLAPPHRTATRPLDDDDAYSAYSVYD